MGICYPRLCICYKRFDMISEITLGHECYHWTGVKEWFRFVVFNSNFYFQARCHSLFQNGYFIFLTDGTTSYGLKETVCVLFGVLIFWCEFWWIRFMLWVDVWIHSIYPIYFPWFGLFWLNGLARPLLTGSSSFLQLLTTWPGFLQYLQRSVIFRLPSSPLVGTGSWVFPKYGLPSLLGESCSLLLNDGWPCWELLLCADPYTWFNMMLVKVSIFDARFLFASTRLCFWDELIVSSVFALLEGLWVSVSSSTMFNVIFVFDFLCRDLLRFATSARNFTKDISGLCEIRSLVSGHIISSHNPLANWLMRALLHSDWKFGLIMRILWAKIWSASAKSSSVSFGNCSLL